MMHVRFFGSVIAVALMCAGCQTIMNTTMEKVFGYEKRQLMANAVSSLKKDQQKAQEEFKDALTQLKELYNFEGGKLEDMYKKFKGAYEKSQVQANTVHSRIKNMEDIAKAMFSEWEKEIKQYSNPTFAANSKRQLIETKNRYAQLSSAVHASAETMKPVLTQLNDNVLYLKHNLNAASLDSLKGEAGNIQNQIEQLIRSMNDSIVQADAFIATLPK